MKKWIVLVALVIVASFIVCPASMAAKAKPKPKPAVKKKIIKKPTAKPHIVLGSKALSGEDAQLGTEYTLGKTEPFNITLKSAEFSVAPILVGDRLFTVNADEKFLVLHMKYKNPRPTERFIRWDSFVYTAVDGKDQNHDGLIDLGAEKDNTSVSMSMKPTQSKDVFGAIIVPAAGEIPKLIIKGSDELVLRYNLKGKVKALPAPYADAEDKTGSTALAKVTATAGTAYPVDVFSFKLNKAEFIDATKIGESEASEGEKLLIVSFTVKNMSPQVSFFRWDTFDTKLLDADGIETGNRLDVFRASSDKNFGGNVEPAQELNLRYAFSVASDVTLKTFTVKCNEGRIFEFDISDTK